MQNTLARLPKESDNVILTEQKSCSECGNYSFNLTGSDVESELTAKCTNCGKEEKLQRSITLCWE